MRHAVRFAPSVRLALADAFAPDRTAPRSRQATEADVAALRAVAESAPVRRQHGHHWDDAARRHTAGLAAGLHGAELLAAELAAGEGPDWRMPLPAARILARRMTGAARWFASSAQGRTLKAVWPTISARDLAEAQASFEAFATVWTAVADPREDAGSSNQFCGQDLARIVGLIAERCVRRGLPRWAVRTVAAMQVLHGPHPGVVRIPSLRALRLIAVGRAWFGRAGAIRWATPTVRIYRTLGRLSPGARRVYLDGLAEGPTAAPLPAESRRLEAIRNRLHADAAALWTGDWADPAWKAASERCGRSHDTYWRLRDAVWLRARSRHASAQHAYGLAAVARVQRGGAYPACPIQQQEEPA